MTKNKPFVPPQFEGGATSTTHTYLAKSLDDAEELFRIARTRLFAVNSWNATAGGGAEFQLIGEDGEKLYDTAKLGNYIRISIPGVPGLDSGKGFEWVRISHIYEHRRGIYAFVTIRVNPASPPFARENQIAHFFSAGTTSDFSIELRGRKLIAGVYGRNEKPNTGTQTLGAKIRNLLVGLGAMLGFNKPQWKKLIKGFLKKPMKLWPRQ